MITSKEYFSNPNFNYEDIKERIEEVIMEGIEKYGESVISLDSEFEAGKVSVWKEYESGKGLNIGKATISLRYSHELLRQCHKAGLSVLFVGTSERECSPRKMVIYVDPENVGA